MGTDDRIELQRFVEKLRGVVALNADCTVSQVIAFLTIALNPGINITQLSKLTGTTLISASRHYRAFGLQGLGERCLDGRGELRWAARRIPL